MDKATLLGFAQRDWNALARSKAEHWARVKKSSGPAAAVLAGEALRQHARLLRPDWPTKEDQRRDLETHARVAAALRSVASVRAR